MTATIPVPVWLVVLFVVLGVAWSIAGAVRDRAAADLWAMYWRERYGEENQE